MAIILHYIGKFKQLFFNYELIIQKWICGVAGQ